MWLLCFCCEKRFPFILFTEFVLGLQDLRWAATDAELKKAYKKLVLKYHPDKLNESDDRDKTEATFRAIQKVCIDE